MRANSIKTAFLAQLNRIRSRFVLVFQMLQRLSAEHPLPVFFLNFQLNFSLTKIRLI